MKLWSASIGSESKGIPFNILTPTPASDHQDGFGISKNHIIFSNILNSKWRFRKSSETILSICQRACIITTYPPYFSLFCTKSYIEIRPHYNFVFSHCRADNRVWMINGAPQIPKGALHISNGSAQLLSVSLDNLNPQVFEHFDQTFLDFRVPFVLNKMCGSNIWKKHIKRLFGGSLERKRIWRSEIGFKVPHIISMRVFWRSEMRSTIQ